MIRARVYEDAEQSMAQFLSGLNKPIKHVVEFQTYNNAVELVHIAQKAEQQLHDDAKPNKNSTFSSRASSSAPKTARLELGRGMFSSGSGSVTSRNFMECYSLQKYEISKTFCVEVLVARNTQGIMLFFPKFLRI